ncbi:hypothetical protein CEXT_387691 [Caerostris extrusa]|uniref:Uncharacterized protein n=1 Tax=Caerostris extrusa TaxID=172846 RepID=A0AAV4QAV5_CAEEX|nr:hypothetical protein CEXT_387691 [Caerostris extrusa]
MEICNISFRYFCPEMCPMEIEIDMGSESLARSPLFYFPKRHYIFQRNYSRRQTKFLGRAASRGEDFAITKDPYFCAMEEKKRHLLFCFFKPLAKEVGFRKPVAHFVVKSFWS